MNRTWMWILKQMVQVVPVLLVASAGLFLLLRMLPGDPSVNLAGPDATPEMLEQIRQDLALDRPLPLQYFAWISGVVTQFRFGDSIVARRPVTDLLGNAWMATFQLVIAAMLVATVVGFALGILAARYQGTRFESAFGVVNAMMIGIPTFWLAFLLVLLFSVHLRWLPSSGFVSVTEDPVGGLKSLILPAVSLGLLRAGIIARFVRTSVVETRNLPHVATARSTGVSGLRTFNSHIMRNAMIPLVTVISIQIGQLLAGSIVIENVFAWPGVGRLLMSSIFNRDYPVIQAVLVISILLFISINLVTDLLYGAIDPRTRLARLDY